MPSIVGALNLIGALNDLLSQLKNEKCYFVCYNVVATMPATMPATTTTTNKINIWTDGSCLHNPGPGGWACNIVVECPDSDITDTLVSANKAHSTNNEMELTAVIEAFDFLYQDKILVDKQRTCITYDITVYSDSNYVVMGITKWINKWLAGNNTSRPNWKLWRRLHDLDQKIKQHHKVSYCWVKAHSNNEKNNQVDILARSRALELTNRSK